MDKALRMAEVGLRLGRSGRTGRVLRTLSMGVIPLWFLAVMTGVRWMLNAF